MYIVHYVQDILMSRCVMFLRRLCVASSAELYDGLERHREVERVLRIGRAIVASAHEAQASFAGGEYRPEVLIHDYGVR